MSRNESRIKSVLSEYDLEPSSIHYDRPRGQWKYGGPEGGWLVISNGHYFTGFNVGELIEDIRFEMEVKKDW